MQGIHKLPFLLGGLMAVISGIISYVYGSGSQSTYIRMAVVMVVFYIIGSYISNTLSAIQEELNKKKEQELLDLPNEEKNLNENVQKAAPHPVSSGEHRVNLVADDSDDEFSPLTISRVIRKE